jgi:hypothetical protein
MGVDDSYAFFDRDDLIYGYIHQFDYLAAGPGDFQRVNLVRLPKPKSAGRWLTCSYAAL